MKLITSIVRQLMTFIARLLNRVSGGRVKPNHITLISLAGHVWFLFLLVPINGYPSPRLAAVVLLIFGLMDALDGALARVQTSSSVSGMFNDAVSDRLKEVIVFSALALFMLQHPDYNPNDAWLAVVALGISMLVSYIKAKGEMAVAGLGKKVNVQELNRLFGDGIARYEVRMTLVIFGLLFPILPQALYVIIALGAFTALLRYIKINTYLKTAG